MKPARKNAAPRRSNQPTQLPKTEIPSSSVYGFLASINIFQSLQESEPAVSTNQSQSEDRLVNPRTTRLARQQVARGSVEQGTLGYLSDEGICHTVPQMRDEQGVFASGDCDQPVSSRIHNSFFLDSSSVSPLDIFNLQSDGNV